MSTDIIVRRNLGSTLAIVPAYNEGPRLAPVLEVVTAHPLVDAVVVVDDGSDDETSRVAGRFPVTVLRHRDNRGKGAALQTGIDTADPADLYLFLDADLINLKPEHIDALLAPLAEADGPLFTIGVFKGGNPFVHLAQNLFPVLNGQRAFKGELIRILPDLSFARFGVEVLLNRFADEQDISYQWVPLHDISHYTKEAKRGFAEGVKERIQMFYECLDMAINYHRKVDGRGRRLR